MKSKAVTFANFLRQPYPYYFNQQGLGKLVLAILFLSFFFLYFFEPFKVVTEEHRIAYFWICFLHAAVSSGVFYGCYTLINFLKIDEQKWTITREAGGLIFTFLLIGLANFLLRDIVYDNPNNWSLQYLYEEIRNTFLVGIMMILILVPLNFARIYSRNSRKAELHQAASEKNSPTFSQVFIETQLKADDFILDLESFLFAKAEGNYLEFHFTSESEKKKQLKRITIKDLEAQLATFSYIIKTHRSYLVNLKNVTEVSGNAQGYQLTMKQNSANVPVSRGSLNKFDEAFNTVGL